jgi:hypothetical protein
MRDNHFRLFAIVYETHFKFGNENVVSFFTRISIMENTCLEFFSSSFPRLDCQYTCVLYNILICTICVSIHISMAS